MLWHKPVGKYFRVDESSLDEEKSRALLINLIAPHANCFPCVPCFVRLTKPFSGRSVKLVSLLPE
jgi:hypothetical protein